MGPAGTKDICITYCTSAQVPEAMAFIDAYWRAGHVLSRDEALFRWQFAVDAAQRAGGLEISMLLAWHGDRLVGMLGLIPTLFTVKGETIRGAWTANLRALADCGIPGVGMQLMLMAQQEFEVMAVLGINDEVAKLNRLLGYQLIEDLPRWCVVLDAAAAAPLFGGVGVDAVARDSDDAVGDIAVTAVTTAGDLVGWDGCWSAIAQEIIAVARDEAYLTRRFLQHPRFAYRLLMARRGADAVGLAVTRLEAVPEAGCNVLRILEFWCRPEAEDDVAAAVIRSAAGAAFADFYCLRPALAKALERRGFRRCMPTDVPAAPAYFQPVVPGYTALRGGIRLSKRIKSRVGLPLAGDACVVTKADGDQDRPN